MTASRAASKRWNGLLAAGLLAALLGIGPPQSLLAAEVNKAAPTDLEMALRRRIPKIRKAVYRADSDYHSVFGAIWVENGSTLDKALCYFNQSGALVMLELNDPVKPWFDALAEPPSTSVDWLRRLGNADPQSADLENLRRRVQQIVDRQPTTSRLQLLGRPGESPTKPHIVVGWNAAGHGAIVFVDGSVCDLRVELGIAGSAIADLLELPSGAKCAALGKRGTAARHGGQLLVRMRGDYAGIHALLPSTTGHFHAVDRGRTISRWQQASDHGLVEMPWDDKQYVEYAAFTREHAGAPRQDPLLWLLD